MLTFLITASILLINYSDLQQLHFEFREVFWTRLLYIVYEVLKST